MRTLAIDTSSKACSAAIFDGQKLLWEGYLDNGNTHSCTLMPLISQGLDILELQADAIEGFAVSKGPGSFTGLRIGLATVKGLAFGTDKPCVGVSTLLGLAYNLPLTQGHILSVLDARAGQVYAALFEVIDGVPHYRIPDCALPLSELADKIPTGSLLIGDGAELVYRQLARSDLSLAPAHLRLQRASGVGLAALHLTETQEPPTDCRSIELAYLRKPQAERERLAALQQP